MVQNGQMSLFQETEDYGETDRETTHFEIERNCFKHLRENLSNEAKAEYETGVKHLVERYNTAIYENRFTVGGVVEVFTLALMRATGIEIEGCGSEAQGGDLILPNGRMFSLKSSFTRGGALFSSIPEAIVAQIGKPLRFSFYPMSELSMAIRIWQKKMILIGLQITYI